MLNPKLQQSLDEELQNSPQYVRDFVTSKYWEDTMRLIARVNNIQKEDIIEGLELETILIIINISDYTDIYEAIKSEVFVNDKNITEASIRQIAEDIESYIIDKLNQNQDKDSLYIKNESIREEIKKQIEETHEILPENYIEKRYSKPLKKDNKKHAPNINDAYRERLDDTDMIFGKYTVASIKPKDRVKEISV